MIAAVPVDQLLRGPSADIAQAARDWAARRHSLARHRLAARDAGGAVEAELWAEIAALGWPELRVAADCGGLGGTLADACTLAEVMGESLLALPWIEHAVFAVAVLANCPASAARDRALAAAGAHRYAVAAGDCGRRHSTEPLTCRQAASPGSYRVDGFEPFVAGAPGAGRLIVGARLLEAGGAAAKPVVLVVDAAAPGVAIAPGIALDGHRFGQVRFGSVLLDDVALLARGGAARDALEAAADEARLALCAEACGIARMVLALTVEHLKTRRQFGQPIGRFQALQHRAADMRVSCDYAAALAWSAIEAFGRLGAAQRSAAASAAKAEVLRQVRFVTAQAMQLHGAMGFTDEMPLAHAFKRAVAIDALLGDRACHLERLGSALAGGLTVP
jgi:alkylation response protein AidB-like acyl-CoA dehydrogenase